MPSPPASLARLKWPLVEVKPNQLVQVDWMEEVGRHIRSHDLCFNLNVNQRPDLGWPAERGALYTLILADAGIARLGEQQALHWMVTNIPGNAISEGSEVIQYLTPFSLELDEEGQFITDRVTSSHHLLALVFRQPGLLVFYH